MMEINCNWIHAFWVTHREHQIGLDRHHVEHRHTQRCVSAFVAQNLCHSINLSYVSCLLIVLPHYLRPSTRSSSNREQLVRDGSGRVHVINHVLNYFVNIACKYIVNELKRAANLNMNTHRFVADHEQQHETHADGHRVISSGRGDDWINYLIGAESRDACNLGGLRHSWVVVSSRGRLSST
jgi:hypothetical protein